MPENTVPPKRSGATRHHRLWIILFIFAWIPIMLGLLQRLHLVLDSEFWAQLSMLAPRSGSLRIYWLIMIPMIVSGLVAAAVVLLARRPHAALIAAWVFMGAIGLNIGEVATITAIHRTIATTLGAEMGIPPSQVAGIQVGITLSLISLAYKVSCLLYLQYARQVRETFGTVTWSRLRLWASSTLTGKDMRDEAAA
jgi:hypothetical protein